MVYILGCAAQIIVITINALVIRFATRIVGDREHGFKTALKTSFYEIIYVYLLNIVLAALIALLVFVIDILQLLFLDSLVYKLTSPVPGIVFLGVVVLVLMAVIITSLIRHFYSFDLRTSFKAACIVLGIDLVLGCMVWIPLLVFGTSGDWESCVSALIRG